MHRIRARSTHRGEIVFAVYSIAACQTRNYGEKAAGSPYEGVKAIAKNSSQLPILHAALTSCHDFVTAAYPGLDVGAGTRADIIKASSQHMRLCTGKERLPGFGNGKPVGQGGFKQSERPANAEPGLQRGSARLSPVTKPRPSALVLRNT